MTAEEFRELALSLPEATEKEHMKHPDFRVKGKIFATLGPDEIWGMVKLKPKEQNAFVRAKPAVFEPFAGAWGVRGCTKVHLEEATAKVLRPALIAAWRNTAPKNLVKLYEDELE